MFPTAIMGGAEIATDDWPSDREQDHVPSTPVEAVIEQQAYPVPSDPGAQHSGGLHFGVVILLVALAICVLITVGHWVSAHRIVQRNYRDRANGIASPRPVTHFQG